MFYGSTSTNNVRNLGVSLVMRDAARRIEGTLPEAYRLHLEWTEENRAADKKELRTKGETISMLEDIIARLSEENDRRVFKVAGADRPIAGDTIAHTLIRTA